MINESIFFNVYDSNVKQRVNLSEHAYDLIENDMRMYKFLNPKEKFTTFINTLIVNYADDFDRTISDEIRVEFEKIDGVISHKELSNLPIEQKESLKKKMRQEAKDRIIQAYCNYPKQKSTIFRLNKKAVGLYSQLDERVMPFGSLSIYLKALLEKYARLSPAKRECVYYKETVDLIKNNLDKVLRINYLSDTEGDYGKKTFYVKPYKIAPDYSGNCTMLFGLSCEVENYDLNAQKMKPYPLKIANIRSVAVNNTLCPTISKEKKEILDGIINNVDRSFGTEDIIVKFTDAGFIKFNKIWHNRPTDFEKNSDGTYTFHCSYNHALWYFWKLVSDVEIISPKSLRETYKENLAKMNDIYKK